MNKKSSLVVLAFGVSVLLGIFIFRRPSSHSTHPDPSLTMESKTHNRTMTGSRAPSPGKTPPTEADIKDSTPVEPNGGVKARVRLEFYTHDGRSLTGCQIIAFGEGRVMKDYRPKPEDPRARETDIEVLGSNQRMILIPDDPELAATSIDITNLKDGDAQKVSVILQKGTKLGGVVVNSRGEPLPDAVVWAEIHLPAGSPTIGPSFAQRISERAKYSIHGDSLGVSVSTDGDGRFQVGNLPSSVAHVTVLLSGLERRRVELPGAGEAMRIVVPESPQ